MTAKEAAKSTIRATLDQLKQYLSGARPPRLSESDTKANFIQKNIEALGEHGPADITCKGEHARISGGVFDIHSLSRPATSLPEPDSRETKYRYGAA